MEKAPRGRSLSFSLLWRSCSAWDREARSLWTNASIGQSRCDLVAPAGLGVRVIREHIPVFPETDTICRALALDPMKLLASGALLIAVAADEADSVLTAIEATAVPVVVIGEVRPSSEGITIMTNGTVERLTPAVRDEIARAFEGH